MLRAMQICKFSFQNFDAFKLYIFFFFLRESLCDFFFFFLRLEISRESLVNREGINDRLPIKILCYVTKWEEFFFFSYFLGFAIFNLLFLKRNVLLETT